ncbi:conserved hypothetical protein (putative transposase or invertase) [Salibacterium halotolerans]|uniref:Transposase n=2 Tax=Salibacterium halotolerans TaxID=1884432 RepID=A0A1I5YHE4_9BACI|nr:hypothetical protein [Salibacterium halotolerans]SFQ43570.1 conserved hypothetical protein (putative transposase or invertase) [Salibacterium halotolerans]
MDGREGQKVREFVVSYEKKGMEKGLEQGIEKGKEETKTEIAAAMLKKDMDVDTIVEITGLSAGEILRLNKEEQ